METDKPEILFPGSNAQFFPQFPYGRAPEIISGLHMAGGRDIITPRISILILAALLQQHIQSAIRPFSDHPYMHGTVQVSVLMHHASFLHMACRHPVLAADIKQL